MSSTHVRALAAIFACVAVYGLTLGLLRPLISLILESRDYSRSIIGLVASAPAIGVLLSSFIIPPLIHRYGIRAFMIGTLILDLCVVLFYPLFDNLWAWIAISMLSGTTINCLLVASETWVNEITPDASRGRVMGLYGTTMAAALACGPLIIPLAGITGWTPFLIGAALIVIAAIPLFWATNVSPTMHGRASFSPLSFTVIAPVMVAGVLLFSWKDSIASNLLPVFSVRSGLSQSGAATTLTVLGLGGVFLTYPVGILADRFNRYALMTLCGAGVGLLATLLPVVVGTSSYWLVLFFWGGLFSGLYTLILTIIGQRYRGIDLAIANVAIGAVFGVGTLTGPVLTGIAMDIWDPHGFAVVFAAFSLCFVIFSSLRWYLTPNKEVAL